MMIAHAQVPLVVRREAERLVLCPPDLASRLAKFRILEAVLRGGETFECAGLRCALAAGERTGFIARSFLLRRKV
jgi:hypothetical protein